MIHIVSFEICRDVVKIEVLPMTTCIYLMRVCFALILLCCIFYLSTTSISLYYFFSSTTDLIEAPSKFLSVTARLPGQACHIPSTIHATLYPSKMGCSALVFSHSGRLLAAGCANQDTSYPVIIFEVRLAIARPNHLHTLLLFDKNNNMKQPGYIYM